MRIRVMMKTPGALKGAVENAVQKFWDTYSIDELTADQEDRDAIREAMIKRNVATCAKWFEYGELVTIEICTDSMAATVVELHGK